MSAGEKAQMEKANLDYDKSQKIHAQSLVKVAALKIGLEKMEKENRDLKKEVRKKLRRTKKRRSYLTSSGALK